MKGSNVFLLLESKIATELAQVVLAVTIQNLTHGMNKNVLSSILY